MIDIADWSDTSGDNTDVDGTSIAEGCDPANVNNAIRKVMANAAALRDLIGGAKVTTGSSNTYALTTGISLSAYQQGIPIAFEANHSNTGAATLNVDTIGAKSIKRNDGSALIANDIVAGGIYHVAYEAGADVLLLLNPTDQGITEVVDDTTPQLGGNLDLNGSGITFPGATVTDITGADTKAVSGTAGTNGNIPQWNGDGDLVDGSVAVADLYRSGGTDVPVADGGTGSSTQAGARSNLAAAAKSQDDQCFYGLFVGSLANGDYRIVINARRAGTITQTTTRSGGGTGTATFKINTTALGGTANSISTSEQTQAHASANSFSVGDDIVITISSASSLEDVSFSIEFTETLD